MKIYLNSNIRKNKEIVHKIKSSLRNTTFKEIRKKIAYYFDPNPKTTTGITHDDNIIPITFNSKKNSNKIIKEIHEISNLAHLIRIEINREKMVEKDLRLHEIITKICNYWMERTSGDIKNIKKDEKNVYLKITQFEILANSDNDENPVIHIRFNAKDNGEDKFNKNTIDNCINLILDKIKLKGINDIVNIQNYGEDKVIIFDEETGNSTIDQEFVIYTSGVNLTEIRYINGIDLNKTIANDIVNVYNIFGIEIVRSLLISEISKAYSNAGGEVNYQHIEIIVDQMTMTGSINSIDRHGLGKSDADPLSRASFEKPVEQLLTAALFNEIDNMHGVSSRIMAGQYIKGGTGYCDLILNTTMIENAEQEEEYIAEKYQEIKTENIISDILKRNVNENIFMPE